MLVEIIVEVVFRLELVFELVGHYEVDGSLLGLDVRLLLHFKVYGKLK